MSSEVHETPRSVELLAWLEVNKTPLIAAATVLVVIAIAGSLFQMYAKEEEHKASAALHAVQALRGQSATAEEPGATKYLEVAAEFDGTDAAGRALLFGAASLFSEGEYAASVTEFERFLAAYSHLPFAPTAVFGKASGLDAQGQTDAAVAVYENLLSRYPNSPEANRARMRLGSIYEARSLNAEAVRLYDQVIATAEGGALATEAGTRRESLLLAHPELAPAEVVVDMDEELAIPGVLTNQPINATAVPAE